MIIQRISIGGVAGDTWRVKEVSAQEIQVLVEFAEKWNGVDIKPTDGDYTLFTVTARTSAQAEHFEQQFGMFIERDKPEPRDESPRQDPSTEPLNDWE